MICPYCRTENAAGAIRCAACTSWMTERPPAREWTRAREGAWLGGVAKGLGDRFGLPVAAVRLAFVVATLLAFWGLVIYVALWILMPQEPLALPAPPAEDAPAHRPSV
jgi:phage shock protein PspC (stress-responsive transcriptional regulator)